MSNYIITALPVAGFSIIQIIKFIKLSKFYEVLLTLIISVPYMCYFSPKNKRDVCTQTDEETPTNIISKEQRSFFELFKLFFKNMFKSKLNNL